MGPVTMESMAGQIAVVCPGWRVWETEGLWHGRRTEFLGRPDEHRVCHVDAWGIPGLISAIDAQAALDLAADFPVWSVTRDKAGRWVAVSGGATVTEMTAAGLYSALDARQAAR